MGTDVGGTPCPVLPTGSQGATRKYKVWMRHRYQSCCNRLVELLAHSSFQVKVSLRVLAFASSCMFPAHPAPHIGKAGAASHPYLSR